VQLAVFKSTSDFGDRGVRTRCVREIDLAERRILLNPGFID